MSLSWVKSGVTGQTMKPHFEDAPISVWKEKARIAKVNNNTSLEDRQRTAAHELAHHIYAEHLGVESRGITLGYQMDKEDVAGLTHITEPMREKEIARTLTRREHENYVRAILANGFGEWAALSRQPDDWGDEGDEEIAIRHLKALNYSLQAATDFINESREKAQQFFSDPQVIERIRSATPILASKHWGKGRVGREQINLYLEKGMQ
jgi:hypothetical protein